ncbi:MAG TPA: ParA family protein, partial [Dehalococcoidia bacterium]|nr:ParA family protein [Dehalococcoidia bacterium]
MSARVICLAGVKGGSGTTTLVAALGRLLASAGLRTLLIDADLQGCGLTIMHLDYVLAARSAALNAPCGLAEAADAERNADACILETSLALIPSAYTAPAAARGCEPALERALVETLHASRASYDYVLVDAPACVTPFGQRIGRLADDLVLVAAYDALAVAALSRVEAVLDADGSSRPTWVLPNKAYFPAPATVSGLLDGYRWLPPIPYYRAVALAGARRGVALADDGPDPFAWCLLRAFAELDARLPAVVRDRAGWDVAELRRAWRVEHARAGATLNELERRRVRLESSLRGENGGPTIGFRLVIALV